MLFVSRRVGHYLTLASFVNNKIAVDVFEDCTVAACIRNCQMKCGFRSVWHVGSVDAEKLFPEFLNSLVDCGKIIQDVLGPDADTHYGAGVVGAVVRGFGEIEDIGHQSFFVHPVRGADIIAGGDDTPVFGGPVDRVAAVGSGSFYSAWKKINIGF